MAKFSTDLPDLEEMMKNMPPTKLSSKRPPNNRFAQFKGVQEAFASDPMRCGGCGAKVGSTTVSRVLQYVYQRQVQRAAARNLSAPSPIDHDDAAVIPLDSKNGVGTAALIQTIDYFRELLPDPYVFGKIVAVHALSDVHAMGGATAQTALTLAVVPFCADEAMTEATLIQLLSGVSDVLQDEGVQLVGGHTCEGSELACGLSVQGFTSDATNLLWRKRGGRVGDQIVLTKPLGTGALFAADMRAKARGEFVAEAIQSMTVSNIHASRIAMEHAKHVHACTDVTGFGLVGHLLEMLMANEKQKGLESIGAVLNISNIPFLRGGLQASSHGIFSTLQPQNANNRRAVVNHNRAAEAFPVEYPLLFDPQTAGGLLFFVSPDGCDALLSQLQTLDQTASSTAVIGEIVAYPEPCGQQSLIQGAGAVCTIGSGETVTGQRIRISW